MKKNKKKCVIFGAGDVHCYNLKLDSDDIVIAADGGYDYLKENNIQVDFIVGDLDSISSKFDDNIKTVIYPIKKDETDLMLAVQKGLSIGYDIFHIYGSLGKRMDHTIGNLQIAHFISSIEKKVSIFGKQEIITCITDDIIYFDKSMVGTISIFCISDNAVGVNIVGLEYKMLNGYMSCLNPIGISNRFIGENSYVSVNNGSLMIVYNY